MKFRPTILDNHSRTRPAFQPVSGSNPLLTLLICLLSLVSLAPPASGGQAAAAIELYSFTANEGNDPEAGLVQASDGNFYGTTYTGGTSNRGTVFRISAGGTLTTLHSFTSTDGDSASAAMVQGSDGNLYGTTYYGGTSYRGTVFKITTNGTLTSLYSFTNGTDGEYPRAGLVQGSDGNLYGTTEYGGGTNLTGYTYGTIFKISTNGELTTLYTFTNGTDGEIPHAGLVQGNDGYFYGVTEDGGTGHGGTIFKINTNGVLTTLHSFLFSLGTDGAVPGGALVQATDGNLYGTTSQDGANGLGTVFKITTSGELTTLYSFGTVTDAIGAPLDGLRPFGALMQASDGKLYGTTSEGGLYGYDASDGFGFGTVFQISTNGVLTTLYSLGDYTNTFVLPATIQGPGSALVQGSDGKIYGTDGWFGKNRGGFIYQLTIAPEFQIANLTNNALNLVWSTEAGGKYQLQYGSDPASSTWTNLGSPMTATGATLSFNDPVINAPQRYYRVVLSP